MNSESFPEEEWVAAYRDALADHEVVQSLAEQANFDSLIGIGDDELLLKVNESGITLKENPTVADPWDFAVKGGTDAWRRFARGDPDPDHANFLSMTFQGAMTITGETESYMTLEGDYRKLFANLELLYEAFETMRDVEVSDDGAN